MRLFEFYLFQGLVQVFENFLVPQIGISDVFAHMRTTHYYNSNLIWRTLSCRVDEIIPSDQSRREASRVSDGLTSSMRRDIVPQIKLLF